MKTLGLVGCPVKQSQSDVYHNRFLSHIGRHERYGKFELLAEQLPQFIIDAKQNMIGLSVTMPFKEQIIPLLDEIDETAQKIDAINTVKFMNGKAYGYNTDGKGALQAIQHIDPRPVNKKYAVIVGAGGTAKAIAWELSHAGMEIIIVNRHFEKARALAKSLQAQALPLSELASVVSTKCDLFIQATSVGMFDQSTIISAEKIPSHITILDVLATPKNQWLNQLAQQGSLTISGKLMWRFQALEQYKIWFEPHFKQMPQQDLLCTLSRSMKEVEEVT
jgi:shikimate dehydrogenase